MNKIYTTKKYSEAKVFTEWKELQDYMFGCKKAYTTYQDSSKGGWVVEFGSTRWLKK